MRRPVLRAGLRLTRHVLFLGVAVCWWAGFGSLLVCASTAGSSGSLHMFKPLQPLGLRNVPRAVETPLAIRGQCVPGRFGATVGGTQSPGWQGGRSLTVAAGMLASLRQAEGPTPNSRESLNAEMGLQRPKGLGRSRLRKV